MPAQASTPVALTVKPVRIVIADDHPVFMDGFCAAVRKHKEVAIVGRAHNGLELLTLVEQLQPDVVFTDIKMPVMDGIAATNQIRQRFPGVKVIALSGFTEDCLITDR